MSGGVGCWNGLASDPFDALCQCTAIAGKRIPAKQGVLFTDAETGKNAPQQVV